LLKRLKLREHGYRDPATPEAKPRMSTESFFTA
jgi:hypothetical protein